MTALNDLTDVTITDLQTGQILYTPDGSNWVNEDIGVDSGVQPFNANTSFTNVAETRAANIDMDGNQILNVELKNYSETVVNVAATATTTFDLEDGNVFNLTQDTDITTLNFSNPVSAGSSSAFTLIRTKDATGDTRSISWPGSVVWAEGTEPALTQTSEAVDVFEFFTIDGGTTWNGFVAGLDMS